MKKLLLVLFALILSVVSCDFDYDLRVEASGNFIYADYTESLSTGVYDRGFHSRSLSESQVRTIINDLATRVPSDFLSAIVHMDKFNQIGNSYVGRTDCTVSVNMQGGLDITVTEVD